MDIDKILARKQYKAQYKKNTRRKFACDLKNEEYAEVDEFLKRHKINKAQFVRDSFKKLKKELGEE